VGAKTFDQLDIWSTTNFTIEGKKEKEGRISQSCFNKVGHLLVCKQSKRGWEPQIFYSYFVMSQLYEAKIL
jgi:hypothetical protein